MSRPAAICVGCRRRPDQIEEYSTISTGADCTPEQFVWAEEGTLNPDNGHFLCTDCYIKAGMPTSATGRWVAP